MSGILRFPIVRIGTVILGGAIAGVPQLPGSPPLESDRFLRLGGMVRLRYEHFDNAQWGQGPQDRNGYLLQRFMLHAEAQAGDQVRIFGELKSGLETGRTGGPRPTDEDRLDLHQAFVDWSFIRSGGERATLRVGRQEIALGSSRLVSFREGPNVRLSFDGVRGTWWRGQWRIDCFGLAPVETNRGTFDDSSDPTQRLWGAYATRTVVGGASGYDFYYLGVRRDSARYAQGVADEERHSLGIRWWGTRGGWDFNTEVVVQSGRFGSSPIQAWTIASDTGYTFANTAGKPRFGLRANIASGDRNPQEGALQTFNPLFPRGAYFNEGGLIGPQNFADLHPALTVSPHPTFSFTVDADFFWRQSSRDGLYGPGLNLQRTPGSPGGSHYVGAQVAMFANWKPAHRWSITAGYARFFAGDYLRESGPGEDVGYIAFWVTCTI